jgi:hypothetical protein
MTNIKKRWVSTDAWRGHYEPVPPDGWELLCDCSVVNIAGEQCRDMLARWLRKNKIKYRSGYLRNSNVFSANMYVIIEGGKLTEDLRKGIDNWFVDQVCSTFSIFSGESWSLDVDKAQRALDAVVESYDH